MEIKRTLDERLKPTDDKIAALHKRIAAEPELNIVQKESIFSEIDELEKERNKAANNIEERLLSAYTRIRGNVRNGLAVVTVKRDACGGCFNTVPPQRQADIAAQKKVIVCEHCGRILAGVEQRVF